MNGRGGTRIRATRKPVVVLAGEDRNDRSSLRTLLEGFCPEMQGRIVEITDTPRLRSASQGTLSDRVKVLARKVRARAALEGTDVACVFVHEDLDRPDGDEYIEARERVQRALTSAFGSAHYVLAVAEVEAWLLLYPDAISAFVSSWQVPRQYQGRDTGMLSDPKEVMKHSVSGSGSRYRESDAPAIFAKALALKCLGRPNGSNRSWSQFRTDARDCCKLHIPQVRRPQ